MKKCRRLMGMLAMFVIAMTMISCAPKSEVNDTFVIYSPHPIEFIDPIIAEFEKETGISVVIIRGGTGELISKIQHEQNQKTYEGDVLWGGSIATLMNKKELLFEPYESVNEEFLRYKNTDGYMTRFTMVPSVIMINTNLVDPMTINGYMDLLDPRLVGEIAFASPELSASSYEQLINQLWAMGEQDPEAGHDPEEGWKYVHDLVRQLDGNLLNGSQDVYQGVAEGKFKIGLTFEEPAAKYRDNGAPIELVYPIEGTIVRPDSVAIIKNTDNHEEAKAFIDFVTSAEIQALIGTELNRRPIRSDVAASETLLDYDSIPVIYDDLEWSAANKEKIIERFLRLFEDTVE